MTSSSNLREGSVWIDKLIKVVTQELQAQGTNYQVLPDVGIRWRESMGLKVTIFRACVRSFWSVHRV